jgi:hypothetical protein
MGIGRMLGSWRAGVDDGRLQRLIDGSRAAAACPAVADAARVRDDRRRPAVRSGVNAPPRPLFRDPVALSQPVRRRNR